jgi:hypothetical protein
VSALRLLGAADAKSYRLGLTRGVKAFPLGGVLAMELREGPEGNYLYLASTGDHFVFRVKLPDDLASLNTVIPAATEIEPVLGSYREPGVLAEGEPAPTLSTVNLAIAKEKVRLTRPQGLAFDRDGNLLIADETRVRVMEKAALWGPGTVSTVIGSYATPFLVGDSRFANLNGPSLRYDPVQGNVTIADYVASRVYRLWTARGTR